jgi:predicted permease
MFNLRFAVRTLFKTPFVTAVAIASLALGIGANVAIFSVFDQVLLRPLPVRDPASLVNLAAPGPKSGSTSCNQAGDCEVVFSYPMFRDLERQQTSFEGIAAHRIFAANVGAAGQTVNGEGMFVSGAYFPLLGIAPAAGRLLGPEDDRTLGGSPVAVLGHTFWRTRFDANPAALGGTVTVNGHAFTIVGVAPRDFDGTTFGSTPYVYVPLTMRDVVQSATAVPSIFEQRRNYWLYLFARLKPSVTIEQARTALNVPYHAILNDVEAPLQINMSSQSLARFRERKVVVEPGAHGQSNASTGARAPLFLLFGVTTLVLLIACANIANLLLARSAARASEMAIRLSIGASRLRLILQLLTESALLALSGGILSLPIAQWTLNWIHGMLPAQAARTTEFPLDWTAVGFAAAVTIGTAFLFGLFPAVHSTRPNLTSALKSQAGQPSGGRSAARVRTALATAQIALSMALLASAGLFVRSLLNVSRVDLGVKVDRVVTFAISPGLNGYSTTRTKQLFERLEDELVALPGVDAVSDGQIPLLAESSAGSDLNVEGFDAGLDADRNARFNGVGPGYFRLLGISMLAGRDFTRSDIGASSKVVIVNEAFVKKFKMGRDVIGKRIGYRAAATVTLDREIVGLVQNAKYNTVKDQVPPMFFSPYREADPLRALTFYVRTSADPETLLGQIPKVVASLDAAIPVENLKTMPEQVRENVFLDRLITVLSASFAGLATILAAIGLYGVLAYTVSQRTKEIGLRMALGAAPSRVRGMILRQIGIMTLVGGTIGLAAAVALGRSVGSLLYELRGWDPVVLAIASTALTVVAFSAGLVPALRASRVDPMRALRCD